MNLKKAKEETSYQMKKARLTFQSFFDKHCYIIFALLITGLSLTARELALMVPTNDVVGYIFSWMKSIKEVGFSKFYTIDSDYSPLYLFIISIFTLLPEGAEVNISGYVFYTNWMYYLKNLFFLVEIGSAIGLALIAKHLTHDKKTALLAYSIYLCLPVQFFNSAIWGNCDSLYFCCFVYILYFILKKKDFLAYFILGIAFGIKLQAVFIIPFMVYLIVSGRMKLYPIFMVAVGLFLTFLPAFCCGANFTQVTHYITAEMNGYSKLTLGCANLWQLIDVSSGSLETFNQATPVIGLLLIGLFMAIIYMRKIKLTDENVLYLAVFLIAIVPFFLPHMHERYFYSLDVLVVLYALIKKRRYHFIPLMQISSGIAYFHYLAGYYFIESWGEASVHISAFINLFILGTIFYDLLKLESEGTTQKCAAKAKEEKLLLIQEHKNQKQEETIKSDTEKKA